MLPESYKDTMIDTLAAAFPDYRFYRDWNDVKRDDTDLLVVVSFGNVSKLFGTSLGNYMGPNETNPNYSDYAVGEMVPVNISVLKRQGENPDTRADVYNAMRNLEIFIKREFDNLFNDMNVDPYSYRFREEREIGARTHRIMVLSFDIIYTNSWNDIPPENATSPYPVNEIVIEDIGGLKFWVKL